MQLSLRIGQNIKNKPTKNQLINDRRFDTVEGLSEVQNSCFTHRFS